MIGVLLFILKCIGILLLALVCLLLLITLVVLLAPIRYEAGGEKTDAIRADGQIKWLFVQVVARWQMGDKEPFVDLCIFGKSLLEKKKAKAARKKRKKPRPQKEGDLIYTREKAAPPKDTPPRPVMEPEVPKQPESKEVMKEEPPKEEIRKEEISKEEPSKEELPKEEIPKEAPEEMKKEPNTVRPMQKKQGMRRVRLEDIEEEKPTEPEAEDIPDDLDEAFFTGEDGDTEEKEENPLWKQLLAVEDKKGIAKALWKFIKRMAKGILPGHLIIKGTFGTGDPVWTGYLLAMAGILKGKFGEDLEIKGDFAKATAENIVVRVKGKIVPGYLLYSTLAFALAKPVRRLIMTLWKGRKQHE
ncbi:hypothetical protein [Anaerotignum sp.]|uniref:hypothetical protein n=1 Tax=Anaerotignum sp. TaxID=2039241 RepID=UPI0029D85476|nr:hypothetical protein [Anaerotignum sp.]MCI6056010.1 hypothetical protein [Clostridia bacterium]MDY3596789.1 hypothetical protein [Anaerotignum sp.]